MVIGFDARLATDAWGLCMVGCALLDVCTGSIGGRRVNIDDGVVPDFTADLVGVIEDSEDSDEFDEVLSTGVKRAG
jgi:hypothetical protein